MIRAAAVVALIVALLGTAYWALPWILQTVIVQQAAARGVVVSELQIQRPVWGVVVIDSAVIGIGGNEVRIGAAVVEYTWDSLSASRATAVTLASVNIAATVEPSAPSSDTAPLEIGQLIAGLPAMFADAWELVPADSLAVGEVQLESELARFAGAMEFSTTHAALRGRVDGQAPIPALQVSAQVTPAGTVQFQARDLETTGNTIVLQADLAAATGTLTGAWTLTVAADDGPIAVEVRGSAPIVVSQSGWAVDAGMALSAQTEQWRAAVDVAHAEGIWKFEPAEIARVAGDWRGTFELDPVELAAQGSLSATLGAGALALTLQPGTLVSANAIAGELAGEAASIAASRIELLETTSLAIDLANIDYRLQSAANLAVQLDDARWSEYRLSPFVSLTVQELSGDLGDVLCAFELQVPTLQLSGAGHAAGSLSGAPMVVEFSAEQLINKPLLASLWPKTPWLYDVDAGRVVAGGKVQLGDVQRPGLTGTIRLTATDLNARYEEVTALNIDAELGIEIDDGVWQMGPGPVAVASTDVGFPITSLAADVTLDAERATVTDLRGQALGGDLSIAALAYDIAGGSSEFVVEATGVQLADVLALEGETITGQGTLDGQLPVHIATNEVTVRGGQFSARPPGGTVSYRGAEGAAAALNQPGVGFAIAALANFTYGVLDVAVNYAPNGDLLLGVHLEGRNPSFEGGRPIHYNLNVSENIPALLQSLQLSDEVGKQLEKRLQR